MYCPNCGNKKTLVMETRSGKNKTYRQKQCPHCYFVFYTEENIKPLIGDMKNEWKSLNRGSKNKAYKK